MAIVKSDDGCLSMSLPTWKDATHSVQSGPSMFVVCGYTMEEANNICRYATLTKFIEVEGNKSLVGWRFQPLDGSNHLADPRHVAITGDGAILVADGEKDHIVLFDSELKFKRILLHSDKLQGKPNRLHYDKHSKQLMVATDTGLSILVWK